jgi:hypothetical protein
VLYNFTDGDDGGYPTQAPLLADNGAIYGTALDGGTYGSGVAFQLMPPASPGASWTEKALYSFPVNLLGGGVGLSASDGVLFGAILEGS